MTKRIIVSFALVSLLFVGSSSVAFAETTAAATTDVAALQAKVQMLMAQIESLKAMSVKQSSQIEELRAELKLSKRLHVGDKGDDVKTLQQILATDPTIFPEGQVTGFFGPLTAKALRRFQEKAGLESVGEVGPRTLELLNKFLSQGGAGNSGKVPEGLLRQAGRMIAVPLLPQNNSGLRGSAMIADNADGKAVVRIKLMGAQDIRMQSVNDEREGNMMWKNFGTSTYPAHIHLGACPTPGAVAYPLTSIVNGVSETVLGTSTKALLGSLPLAINVHKSPTDLASYVACGDLKAPPMLWKMGENDKMMGRGDDHSNGDNDREMRERIMMGSTTGMHQ